MNIIIDSRHFDIGESFEKNIRERISSLVHKYFEHPIKSHVIIEKEKDFFNTEILVNEGTSQKILLKSNSSEHDIHKSFNSAILKLNAQLNKYKEKFNNKKHSHESISSTFSKVL